MGYLATSSKFAAFSGTGPALPDGSNRMRFGIVFTGFQGSKPAASAFSFGGVAGTKVPGASATSDSTGGEVFYWTEADMGSMSGTAFAVTGPSGSRRFVVFVDFDGINQSAGVIDSGLNSDLLAVAVGDLILSIAHGIPNVGPASWAPADGQTEVIDDSDPNNTGATSVVGAVGYEVATGTSHGFTWTPTAIDGAANGFGGLAIRPAAAGASGKKSKIQQHHG